MVRVGAGYQFRKTPYFAAAFIGGGESFHGDISVRGLRAHRYVGDASAFGNVDLRIFLGRAKLIVPRDFGVFGFGDVGRVFLDGEDSDKWHAGGGIWFSPLIRTNTISLSVANREGETLFYLRFGFHY